eukprot:scaffold8342_cov17-Tisochrysis_lutea.AAC.1
MCNWCVHSCEAGAFYRAALSVSGSGETESVFAGCNIHSFEHSVVHATATCIRASLLCMERRLFLHLVCRISAVPCLLNLIQSVCSGSVQTYVAVQSVSNQSNQSVSVCAYGVVWLAAEGEGAKGKRAKRKGAEGTGAERKGAAGEGAEGA